MLQQQKDNYMHFNYLVEICVQIVDRLKILEEKRVSFRPTIFLHVFSIVSFNLNCSYHLCNYHNTFIYY